MSKKFLKIDGIEVYGGKTRTDNELVYNKSDFNHLNKGSKREIAC